MDALRPVTGNHLVGLATPLEPAWRLVGHQCQHPVQRLWMREKADRTLPSGPVSRNLIRVGVGDGSLRHMTFDRGDAEDRAYTNAAGNDVDQPRRIAHQRFACQDGTEIDGVEWLGMRGNKHELLDAHAWIDALDAQLQKPQQMRDLARRPRGADCHELLGAVDAQACQAKRPST